MTTLEWKIQLTIFFLISLDELNGRTEMTKERISQLKDRSVEIIQMRTDRKEILKELTEP